MTHTQIRCEVEQNLMTITLNRPERLNAFTPTMLEELLEALDLADANDAVRAVIFTGAGRAYCAGADLSSGAEAFHREHPGDADTIDSHRDTGGRLVLRIFESKKPVIAAIN
jgi:enoyl-CoA hydratase/carnithine racemase